MNKTKINKKQKNKTIAHLALEKWNSVFLEVTLQLRITANTENIQTNQKSLKFLKRSEDKRKNWL